MTVIELLNSVELRNPYFVRARRRWRRLTDEQRAEIEAGFARHRRACLRSDVDPDPAWIAEAVEDMTRSNL